MHQPRNIEILTATVFAKKKPSAGIFRVFTPFPLTLFNFLFSVLFHQANKIAVQLPSPPNIAQEVRETFPVARASTRKIKEALSKNFKVSGNFGEALHEPRILSDTMFRHPIQKNKNHSLFIYKPALFSCIMHRKAPNTLMIMTDYTLKANLLRPYDTHEPQV